MIAPDNGPEVLTLRFTAEPMTVRAAVRRAVARFGRHISVAEAGALELALAEVLNNVVEHAYAGRGDGKVVVEVVRKQGALRCQIRDWGVALPDHVLPASAEYTPAGPGGGLREGGWGCHLVRSLTEDLAYDRTDGENCLSFRLCLDGDSGRSKHAATGDRLIR